MTEANPTNHHYFEALKRDNGVNPITENPCKLLDFALLRLDKEQTWQGSTDNRECVAVILGGKATITAGDQTFTRIGKRANVFGGKPFSVYMPPRTSFQISAHSSLEVALCYAAEIPNAPAPQPFLITPAEVDNG